MATLQSRGDTEPSAQQVSLKKTRFEARSRARRGVTAAAVIAVCGLIAFVGATTETASLLFFAAILLAARGGGWRGGIIAALAATVLLDYFFLAPGILFFNQTLEENLRLLLFLGAGALIGAGAARRDGEAAAATEKEPYAQLARRLTERTVAFHQAHAEIEDLYHNAPCGYQSLDADGVFVRINDTLLGWLGYTREEVIGKMRLTDVLPAERAEPAAQTFSILKETGSLTNIEFNLKRKDGTLFPVLISSTAVRDAAGNFVMSRATLFDITERKRAETERRSVLQRLQTHLERSPIAVVEWDTDARVISWSPEAERIFGWTAAEIIGRKTDVDFKFGYPADAAALSAYLQNLRDDGNAPPLRARNFTRDAEIVTCEWIASILQDENGAETLLAFALDVTARERMETALRESERRNRDLVDKSLGLICTHDLDGVMLSVNPAAAKNLGYAPEEAVGKPLADFLAPEAKKQVAAYLAAARERQPLSGLMHLIAKSGEERIWEYHNTYVAEDGKPAFVLGHAQDVTQRRRAEAELRSALQRLRFHVENSPVGMLEWDKDLRVLQWSAEATRIFGWTADEIVGKQIGTDIRFFYEEDIEGLSEVVSRLLRGDDRRNSFANRNYTKNGDVVNCEWFNSALLDERGEVISVMSLALDVTERNQMEREVREARDAALESTRLKSAFLANVSHEIRTPMNGIMGMIDLLLDTHLNDRQRDFASTIRTSADSLLAIINDVLDLSKIEAGKLEFERIDFDLERTFEEAVSLLAGKAQAKNLELVAHIEPSVPTFLNGDPNRLRQVLLNLLGNALKFTERGEIVARVGCVEETADAAVLRFSVADTGIGIDPAAQARLFEPFVQADAAMTRRFGGTGLGLAISRQLIEIMGGEITLESEPGAGSTFSFTAKFGKQDAEILFPAAKRLEALMGLRVLIVDDNRTNCETLAQTMAVWGALPAAAASGVAALNELRRAARDKMIYDAVLFDDEIADAHVLTAALRADESLRRTKIISLAPFGTIETVSANRVCAAMLTKPVRRSLLLECLLRAADGETAQSAEDEFAAEASPAPATNGETIVLLVEDNPVNIKVAVEFLHKLNYRADVATNGREALSLLSTGDYALILMDCQMPVMDGYEAARAIRAREAAAGSDVRVPIVAMTANAMQGDRERCFAAGMDDYLPKPINLRDLDKMLARHRKDEGGRMKDEIKTPETASIHSPSVIAHSSEDSPIEPGVLDGFAMFIEEDANFLTDLIELFVTDMTRNFKKLYAHAEQDEWDEMAFIAHKLKGSGGTFGASKLSLLGERLEADCKARQKSEILNDINAAAAEFARVRDYLRRNQAVGSRR